MHACSQSTNLLPWFGYKAYPTKFGPQLVDAIIERRRDLEDSRWINPLVGSNPDGITRRWYTLSEVRPSYMKEVVSLGPIPCLGVFVFPSSPSFLPFFSPPQFSPSLFLSFPELNIFDLARYVLTVSPLRKHADKMPISKPSIAGSSLTTLQ